MINDPKDIAEILSALDKVTFEQLDKAIKEVDKEIERDEISRAFDMLIEDVELKMHDLFLCDVFNIDEKYCVKDDMNVCYCRECLREHYIRKVREENDKNKEGY